MSYKTLEIELDHGRVRANATESLPARARGLLTILEAHVPEPVPPDQSKESGLRHFLANRDFALTPEQFQTSMATDFWEQ